MNTPPIMIDLHVQRDLFAPGGSLYTRANSRATANVYRLFQWARMTGVPILSPVLLVRPGRQGPFGRAPHCIEGSGGEVKLARTLLSRRVNLGLSHTADLERGLFSKYAQIIFETRDTNILHHAKFERLIAELNGQHTFVLCGATIARGILEAVLGLRRYGHRVFVAEDAVLELDLPDTEMAWLRVVAKDAICLGTDQIVRELAATRRRRRRLPAATMG